MFIKEFGEYNKINGVNFLYLITHSLRWYFTAADQNRYLIIDSTEEYEEVWSRIESEITKINGTK